MKAPDPRKLEIARIVMRLFGAWGRVPPEDAFVGYELTLKRFTQAQLEQGLASAVSDGAGKDQPPNAGAFAAYVKPLPQLKEVPFRHRESWLNEAPPTQAEMADSQEDLADAAARRGLAARDAYDRHPFGSIEQDGARKAMDEARNEEQHFRRAAAWHRAQDDAGTPAGAFGEMLADVAARARR